MWRSTSQPSFPSRSAAKPAICASPSSPANRSSPSSPIVSIVRAAFKLHERALQEAGSLSVGLDGGIDSNPIRWLLATNPAYGACCPNLRCLDGFRPGGVSWQHDGVRLNLFGFFDGTHALQTNAYVR